MEVSFMLMPFKALLGARGMEMGGRDETTEVGATSLLELRGVFLHRHNRIIQNYAQFLYQLVRMLL